MFAVRYLCLQHLTSFSATIREAHLSQAARGGGGRGKEERSHPLEVGSFCPTHTGRLGSVGLLFLRTDSALSEQYFPAAVNWLKHKAWYWPPPPSTSCFPGVPFSVGLASPSQWGLGVEVFEFL